MGSLDQLIVRIVAAMGIVGFPCAIVRQNFLV